MVIDAKYWNRRRICSPSLAGGFVVERACLMRVGGACGRRELVSMGSIR